jgi:hypothetical protein
MIDPTRGLMLPSVPSASASASRRLSSAFLRYTSLFYFRYNAFILKFEPKAYSNLALILSDYGVYYFTRYAILIPAFSSVSACLNYWNSDYILAESMSISA